MKPSKHSAIARLDELAARQGGARTKEAGDRLAERSWSFPSCAACTRFALEAEAQGFQMWASADLAGMLIPSDRNWTSGTYRSCVDGKPRS